MTISQTNLFDPPTVAVVFNDDGTVYDHCFNWETGQSFALSGYRVEATDDDGHMDQDSAQKLYDAELERYKDCFG